MTQAAENRHAIVLAPVGRDAKVASALLAEIGVAAREVVDFPRLLGALGDDVLFVVVAEESLRNVNLGQVSEWVEAQESWSDLPFIIMTRHGGGVERNTAAVHLSEAFRNINFLERPFHPTTFASVAKTAMKGRMRQFEARASLEELREAGSRLATALVAGRLGAWELDVDTLTLTTSAACRAAFGRGPDDPFDYSDLLRSIHPDDLPERQALFRRTLETGEDYVIEYRVIWPDGSLHWVDVRARLVPARWGAQIIGVTSDITARKAHEALLRTENERLEERVAARTSELEAAHREREATESKLRQSQKLEMIGQLTGGIAHDFNNLLMAVIGNLDLMKKGLAEDPRLSRLLDGALQGARRGATLTQRLLAFARRQELSLEVADLAVLAQGMTPLIERTIGRSIELAFKLPSVPVLAELDVNQVEVALLNLVVNARDAMPSGGTLTIGIDRVDEHGAGSNAGALARLYVDDNGHGMDEETLRKAVEPFFSTKGVGKGTGLGLSMIHGLADQLGGVFRLSSEVGLGTRAELLLPLTEKRPVLPPAETVTHPPTALESQRLRILVVDDDVLIAMSTTGMLEDLGHDVVEAHSGEAALKALRDGDRVDLMITDFSMPKMNGAMLARSARDLFPQLPILLATGYAELPPGEGRIDLPRLAKPYDQAQLEEEIRRVMTTEDG